MRDYFFRHRSINLAGEFDEARFLAKLFRAPGEIEGINWDAMAAESWTGIKRHEPKWLGARRGDDFPYIYIHRAVDGLEFVHERDVDGAENIFEQLGGLGSATIGNRNNFANGPAVSFLRRREACGRVTADDLGDL